MIFKSKFRSRAKELAKHLCGDKNEKVTIIGASQLFNSNDIHGALIEMEAIGKTSNCKKYLYHTAISPDKKMTKKEWDKFWTIHDETHGLVGCSYIEIEHIKKGRTHRHRVYCRVDAITGKAVPMSFTYKKNERIAREAEYIFGHNIILGKHNKAVMHQLEKEGKYELSSFLAKQVKKTRPTALLNQSEWQMEERGMDVESVGENIYQAWKDYELNGGSVEDVFFGRGFFIAKGDKAMMAISRDGVHLPILRWINANKSKNGEGAIRKRVLDAAINEVPPNYAKYKCNLDSQYVGYFKKMFSDCKKWIKLTPSEYFNTPLSEHHFHTLIKNEYKGKEASSFKLMNGVSIIVRHENELVIVQDKGVLIGGERLILDSANLIKKISENKKWNNVNVKSSNIKYKQYYTDLIPVLMAPQFSANSSKKSKKQTTTEDEIELVSNEEDMIRHRRKILLDEYFEELEESELADYWSIKKLPNGYIEFKNKNGSFVDKGNKISVSATPENQQACSKGALGLAKLKGWKKIAVKGTNDFKLNVYRQADTFGIEIQKDSDYDAGLMKKVITDRKNKSQQAKNESKTPEAPKEVLSAKKPRGPGM